MKILIPLDIVHPVQPIVQQIMKLVVLKDAEVSLLYVQEELPAYESLVGAVGKFENDWEQQLHTKAQAALQEAKNLLDSHCAQAKTEIVPGPPSMIIDAVARDGKFDLVAITPGQHSRVEKFFLGSVTSGVVKHCPGTILICRPQKTGEHIKHVVMGIDGSPQSRHALRTASKQLHLVDSNPQITLVHVVTIAEALKVVSPIEYISLVEDNLLMEGETYLAEGKRLLAEQGLNNVSCVLKEGDPTTQIIQIASELPADLIVIGAQGRTAVQHFLLGSVSNRIAMHAPCPTAVVKMPHN